MKTRSTLDHAAEQIADGAIDAAEAVVDTLTDVASDAMELVAGGGQSFMASTLSRLAKRPKAIVGIVIVAAIGAWAYKRFVANDDPTEDAIADVPSLRR